MIKLWLVHFYANKGEDEKHYGKENVVHLGKGCHIKIQINKLMLYIYTERGLTVSSVPIHDKNVCT